MYNSISHILIIEKPQGRLKKYDVTLYKRDKLFQVNHLPYTCQELEDWGESIKPIAKLAYEGKGEQHIAGHVHDEVILEVPEGSITVDKMCGINFVLSILHICCFLHKRMY